MSSYLLYCSVLTDFVPDSLALASASLDFSDVSASFSMSISSSGVVSGSNTYGVLGVVCGTAILSCSGRVVIVVIAMDSGSTHSEVEVMVSGTLLSLLASLSGSVLTLF